MSVLLILFCFIADAQNSLFSSADWAPLVRLFTESSVSSFRLHIKSSVESNEIDILTSLAELIKLVHEGMLVNTPQTPSTSKH